MKPARLTQRPASGAALLTLLSALGCSASPSPAANASPRTASAKVRPEPPRRTAGSAPAPAAAAAPPTAADAPAESSERGEADTPGAWSPTPTPSAPQILVEPPHPLHRRPRAEGRVQASTDDEALARWNVGGCSAPDYRSNRPGFHPAPRVVIDTRVIDAFVPERSRKTLSRRRILSRCRDEFYWSTRICYEQLLRASDPDHAEVRVRMDIGADGRVGRTVLQDVKTGARAREADLVACLTEALAAIAFTPRPGRRVRVDVRIRLWPGDAPLPSLPALPASDAGGVEPRSVDPESPRARALRRERRDAIASRLETLGPTVSECFNRGRARDPRLWGRLAVALTFDERGHVDAASQHESHFPDPEVVRCVLDAVRDLAVPASSAADDAWVVAFRLVATDDPLE